MGYSRWSGTTYQNIRSTYQNKSRDEIFKSNQSRRIHPDMNPFGLGIRESRDSPNHPNSLAISVFLDVTGSMGKIPEVLVRHKLGTLMNTMLDCGVQDPQVMFSAIGDHLCDRAPLQVGQFESGAEEMNNCLSKFFLEGGGGGQWRESYILAWLIAGRHTSIDCWEKRRQKGFLFTVGDEGSWNEVDQKRLKNLMGYDQSFSIQTQDILAEAEKKYHVYHIHINETSYKNHPTVLDYWRNLLGERLLVLDNHNLLAELIATAIAVQSGINFNDVATHFNSQTTSLLSSAISRRV